MKILLNNKKDPWGLRENEFFKETGIDPYECKDQIGDYVTCMHDYPDYPPRKILNVFWSTPCGYWTICYVVEGNSSPMMRSQIREFLK